MGYSKQLTQDEDLSLMDYLNLYSIPKLNHIDQSSTLLAQHEDHLYIYCAGNNTILVLNLGIAKFDKGFYGNFAYKIIRIKPPPNFTVNHMQILFSHNNVSMLLWGVYGVYIIGKLPKVLPNTPHLLFVKGVILEKILLNKETIIKCKFNSSIIVDHTILYIGLLTSIGNFSIYQLNNKERLSSFNNNHSLFATNLCSGELFPSDISKLNQSYIKKFLNIQGALYENYVDFVFCPWSQNILEIYFLQGTGAILAYDLTLALNPDKEDGEIVAKIIANHSYHTQLVPELEESYDSDIEYTSLTYIAAKSPDILVVVQHVNNTHETEVQDDNFDNNIILRHYAIIKDTHKSLNQIDDMNDQRSRLYLIESLGFKVGQNAYGNELLLTLPNAEAPSYLVSLSQKNSSPITLLITLAWTVDAGKLLDIFVPQSDSPTSEEEISDLITYNVNIKSTIRTCLNEGSKGCVLLGACCANLKTQDDITVLQLLSQPPPAQGCRLMFVSLDKVTCQDYGQPTGNASSGEADAFVSRLISMIADSQVSASPDGHALQSLLIDVMYGTDTALYDTVKSALSSSFARLKLISKRLNDDDTFQVMKDPLDAISKSVVSPNEQIAHKLGLKIEAIVSEMAKQRELKATLGRELGDLQNDTGVIKVRLEGARRTLKSYFGRALKLVEGYDGDTATKHFNTFAADMLRKCQVLTCSLTSLQEYYVKLEMAHTQANIARPESPVNSPTDLKGKKLDLYVGMINDHDTAIGRLVKGVEDLKTSLIS